MNALVKKALELIVGDDTSFDLLRVPRTKKRPLKVLTERELLRLESAIGAEIFGKIPEGHRREFFCLDEKTWIWHEEWTGENRKSQTRTIRYEIGDHGVLKVQDGARYNYIEGAELQNFALAIRMYYEHVARKVYKRDPDSGQKLV
ncbi:hypothetical protein H7Y29_01750 [Microbacteriaceae bacterium]|nr:hypothetical protein [Candidatus Saccharibacteria bacterium]